MRVDLGPIIDCLDSRKEEFIAQCRRDIQRKVESYGRSSLAIREVGGRVHYPAPDSYVKVLWKFRNSERYNGHSLESVLSEPISELVVDDFNTFLDEHRPDVEAQLKQQVAEAIDVSELLEKMVFDELRKKGVKHVRHEAVHAFVHACQAAFHSQLAHTTSTTVAHTVTTSVGTVVGASIAHALTIAVAHAIGTALVHLAHSVAFKAVLKTLIVHSVGAIVTAVLVKMIASHMTAASAGAILGPFVWAVGATYVFYKIMTIPETLGEELGDALAQQLRGDFREWTETALEEGFRKLTDPEELLKSVAKTELDSFLPEIIGEVGDKLATPPTYEEVDKEVGKLVGYGEKGVNKLQKKRRNWFW